MAAQLISPISHEPAIFSSRGALHPRSEARLLLLGLSKLDLSDLCLRVVRSSLMFPCVELVVVKTGDSAVWTHELLE